MPLPEENTLAVSSLVLCAPGTVFTGTAKAITFFANSDVSVKTVNPALLLVAVALMNSLAVTVVVSVALIVALPEPSVVTLAKPR